MLYGIYKIQDIINNSDFLFGNQDLNIEHLKIMNDYDLKHDFLELYHMLSDIKDIIDKMIKEGDENNEL